MRAFFVENLASASDEITLLDEAFNHLKVVRLKENEEILLLDGKGTSAVSKLVSLQKRSAILAFEKKEFKKQSSTLDIALGLLKKDAFDLCLKMAVELGVRRIYPLYSKFAQRYEINRDRAARLLQQALEQSNGAWLPELMPCFELNELVQNCENYQHTILMGMDLAKPVSELGVLGPEVLGFIGPEGGFDSDEEEKILALKNSQHIHLPCSILRAPTALAALGGVIFTKQVLLD